MRTYTQYISDTSSVHKILLVSEFENRFGEIEITSRGNIMDSDLFKHWEDKYTETDLIEFMDELSNNNDNLHVINKYNRVSLYEIDVITDSINNNTGMTTSVVDNLMHKIDVINSNVKKSGIVTHKIIEYSNDNILKHVYMITIMYKIQYSYIYGYRAAVYRCSSTRYNISNNDNIEIINFEDDY